MFYYYLLLFCCCEILENLFSFSFIGDCYVVIVVVVGSYGVEGFDGGCFWGFGIIVILVI